MSAASVLGAVAELKHCRHTGLMIPECCCWHCCEALLCRYAPELLAPVSSNGAAQSSRPRPKAAPLSRAADRAAPLGISVADPSGRARRSEVLR
jgi:hypothetical protein